MSKTYFQMIANRCPCNYETSQEYTDCADWYKQVNLKNINAKLAEVINDYFTAYKDAMQIGIVLEVTIGSIHTDSSIPLPGENNGMARDEGV